MARPDLGQFDSMKKTIDPHHSRITEIDEQIQRLTQESALLRAAAIHELQSSLKLPSETIGHLALMCR